MAAKPRANPYAPSFKFSKVRAAEYAFIDLAALCADKQDLKRQIDRLASSREYLQGWDWLRYTPKNLLESSQQLGKSGVVVNALVAAEISKDYRYVDRPLPGSKNPPARTPWVSAWRLYCGMLSTSQKDLPEFYEDPNANEVVWFEAWVGRLRRLFALREDIHYRFAAPSDTSLVLPSHPTSTYQTLEFHHLLVKYLLGKGQMADVPHDEKPGPVQTPTPSFPKPDVEKISRGKISESPAQPVSEVSTHLQQEQAPATIATTNLPSIIPTPVTSKPIPDDPTNLTRDELAALPLHDLVALNWRIRWLSQARAKQLLPAGNWSVWVLCMGRGAGKTKTGAESIGWLAYKYPGTRWGVVGPTNSAVRGVCFEGESGLMSVIPHELIESSNRSLNEIRLVNGSLIQGFSAEEPERLRGPQFHGVWLDEAAAIDPSKIQMTWDMINFCNRLKLPGHEPIMVVTTTPKPIPLMRKLLDRAKRDSSVIVTTGSTYENKANLAKAFFDEITQYEGTTLGRQEIYAEMIDPEEGGILKRSWFKLWPADKPFPRFEYIVQSYDTAFTEKTHNDPTACSVWGVFEDKPGVYAAMLCDFWTDHLPFDALRKRMIEEYDYRYGEGDNARKPDMLLIEDKGSGISIRQTLQQAGLPVMPYNPGRADKTQRVHAVSHLVRAGRFFIPESTNTPNEPRDWAKPMLEQLCTFPLVEHDDAVDSFTQMAKLLADQAWLEVRGREEDTIDRPPVEYVNPYAV